MTAAENYAGKPPPNGIYEWSPLLELSGQTVTYRKFRLNLLRSKIHSSNRLMRMQTSLVVEDTGAMEVDYVESSLKTAWKALRLVQANARAHRATHMEQLAEHFALHRDTSRIVEMKKITTSETVRQTAAKHKWYLKERHRMIRNLLIPDYCIHYILAIIGVLVFTLLIL